MASLSMELMGQDSSANTGLTLMASLSMELMGQDLGANTGLSSTTSITPHSARMCAWTNPAQPTTHYQIHVAAL